MDTYEASWLKNMTQNTLTKNWKIAFSGVPSAGKTTSVKALEKIAKKRAIENMWCNYNTGRKALQSVSPEYGPSSFMTRINSGDMEKISKFVSQIIKAKK